MGALAPELDLQGGCDQLVATGALVQLVAVNAVALDSSASASFTPYRASDQFTPAACADANDTVCGRHLDGTGTFTVAETTGALAGAIASSTLEVGPGEATLGLVLFGGPVPLPLEKARVEISGIASAGWGSSGKIGGAVAQSDLTSTVYPAIANGARASFAADCEVGGTPPACGCASGSQGDAMRLFEADASQDCMITDAEVEAFMSGFATPEIDLNADGTNDALSVGVGLEAVMADFAVP